MHFLVKMLLVATISTFEFSSEPSKSLESYFLFEIQETSEVLGSVIDEEVEYVGPFEEE